MMYRCCYRGNESMKMEKILILFILAAPVLVNAQPNPFQDLEYDLVVAYEFQGDGAKVIEHCLKNEKDKISKSFELEDSQIQYLEKLVISNSSYGNTTAFCFDPHLGIVYYNQGKVVFSIDICLGCNYLESSVEIPATRFNMIRVSDDYSYPAKGFSKETRKSIHAFCKQLGFDKYLEPLESIYD